MPGWGPGGCFLFICLRVLSKALRLQLPVLGKPHPTWGPATQPHPAGVPGIPSLPHRGGCLQPAAPDPGSAVASGLGDAGQVSTLRPHGPSVNKGRARGERPGEMPGAPGSDHRQGSPPQAGGSGRDLGGGGQAMPRLRPEAQRAQGCWEASSRRFHLLTQVSV